MQTINLGDSLTIDLQGKEDLLTCNLPDLPCDQTNLVLKAVNLFRKTANLSFSVRIHLEKQIPMQAGLGGGSSNAATTLWALNELTGRPFADLTPLAAAIGSDVAFFFSSGSAYCTGRGEIVENIQLQAPRFFWIVKPPYGLPTPKVYGALDLSSLSSIPPKELLAQFLQNQPSYLNDLEQPAFTLQPELSAIKQKLIQTGYTHVSMTGSGTAFFCSGQTLPPSDLQSWRVQTIQRDPFGWY